jgi:predicted TIM-barrel fold metal-dependent hydrolase
VAGLLFGGILRRCPRIRFFIAHAGGTVPYLASRLELAASWHVADSVRAGARDTALSLAGLYYETAQAFAPGTLACLRAVTDESHVLFGTDFPMIKGDAVTASRKAIAGNSVLNPVKVGRENALALFPSLAGGTMTSGVS